MFALDSIVAAAAPVRMFVERPWLPVGGTFQIELPFGLPKFSCLRERALHRTNGTSS